MLPIKIDKRRFTCDMRVIACCGYQRHRVLSTWAHLNAFGWCLWVKTWISALPYLGSAWLHVMRQLLSLCGTSCETTIGSQTAEFLKSLPPYSLSVKRNLFPSKLEYFFNHDLCVDLYIYLEQERFCGLQGLFWRNAEMSLSNHAMHVLHRTYFFWPIVLPHRLLS